MFEIGRLRDGAVLGVLFHRFPLREGEDWVEATTLQAVHQGAHEVGRPTYHDPQTGELVVAFHHVAQGLSPGFHLLLRREAGEGEETLDLLGGVPDTLRLLGGGGVVLGEVENHP